MKNLPECLISASGRCWPKLSPRFNMPTIIGTQKLCWLGQSSYGKCQRFIICSHGGMLKAFLGFCRCSGFWQRDQHPGPHTFQSSSGFGPSVLFSVHLVSPGTMFVLLSSSDFNVSYVRTVCPVALPISCFFSGHSTENVLLNISTFYCHCPKAGGRSK